MRGRAVPRALQPSGGDALVQLRQRVLVDPPTLWCLSYVCVAVARDRGRQRQRQNDGEGERERRRDEERERKGEGERERERERGREREFWHGILFKEPNPTWSLIEEGNETTESGQDFTKSGNYAS